MDLLRTTVLSYISGPSGSQAEAEVSADGFAREDPVSSNVESEEVFEIIDVDSGIHPPATSPSCLPVLPAELAAASGTEPEVVVDDSEWTVQEAEVISDRKQSILGAKCARVAQKSKDLHEAEEVRDKLGVAIQWYRGASPASGSRGILDESYPVAGLSEDQDTPIIFVEPQDDESDLGSQIGDHLIVWNVQCEDKGLRRALNGEHRATVVGESAFRLDSLRISPQMTSESLEGAMVLNDPIPNHWSKDGASWTYSVACNLSTLQESSIVSYTTQALGFVGRQGWQAASHLVKGVSDRSGAASTVCQGLGLLSESSIATSVARTADAVATASRDTLWEAAHPRHWKSASSTESCANCANFFRSSDDLSTGKVNCHECGEVICRDCYSDIELPWKGYAEPRSVCAVCKDLVLVRNEAYSYKKVLLNYICTGPPTGRQEGESYPSSARTASSEAEKTTKAKKTSLQPAPLAACEAPSSSTPTTVQEFMLSPRATSTIGAAEETPSSPPSPGIPDNDQASTPTPTPIAPTAKPATEAQPIAAEAPRASSCVEQVDSCLPSPSSESRTVASKEDAGTGEQGDRDEKEEMEEMDTIVSPITVQGQPGKEEITSSPSSLQIPVDTLSTATSEALAATGHGPEPPLDSLHLEENGWTISDSLPTLPLDQ